MEIIIILMILSGFFVAWNTGANDAANCIGAAVGANILTFKKAAILMAIFVFLGAMLQGQEVMDTTGSGIVITCNTSYEDYNQTAAPASLGSSMDYYFPDARLPDLAIVVALLSAGISVLIATYSSIPLSTSQSIVGGVAGAGLGIVGFQADFFRTSILLRILGSWIISPILTMAVAFIAYHILIRISKRVTNVLWWEKILSYLVIVSSCYFAFALGANAFGAGLGPLIVRFPEMRTLLAASAGIVLGVGSFVFGRRVTQAVGNDITSLDYSGALAAQFAAGMGLQVFAQWGVPVSSSQAIVGAVVGVGLVKGAQMVNMRKIRRIFISWFLTPTFAAILAALLYKGLSLVL